MVVISCTSDFLARQIKLALFFFNLYLPSFPLFPSPTSSLYCQLDLLLLQSPSEREEESVTELKGARRRKERRKIMVADSRQAKENSSLFLSPLIFGQAPAFLYFFFSKLTPTPNSKRPLVSYHTPKDQIAMVGA